MQLTPRQRRTERKNRNQNMLDMNLVSLIDVFTILIFFLLSSASGVELMASPKSVELPLSTAAKGPTQTVVITVSDVDILVEGRKVASVDEALALQSDLIPRLKEELDALSGRPVIGVDKPAQSQAVTIMGDKDIPYRLLRKVMYTSAQANMSDISFAVRRKD